MIMSDFNFSLANMYFLKFLLKAYIIFINLKWAHRCFIIGKAEDTMQLCDKVTEFWPWFVST